MLVLHYPLHAQLPQQHLKLPNMGLLTPAQAPAYDMNGMPLASNFHQYLPAQPLAYPPPAQEAYDSKSGLMAPIPPLHIQQQIVNHTSSDGQNTPQQQYVKEESVQAPAQHTPAPPAQPASDQMLRSLCLRCKKEFDQPIIIPQTNDLLEGPKTLAEPKIYKLCQHCRDLQRQRSRRWQKKTKDKTGSCRRCGTGIPEDQQEFVLCPLCRLNLRTRKANRAAQGKCVHCLGPLNASIITDDGGSKKDKSKSGNYKVCQRCRENDKIRRTNLEKMGKCNRCAKALDIADHGKHKVCLSCRNRKKKLNQPSASNLISDIVNTGTLGGMKVSDLQAQQQLQSLSNALMNPTSAAANNGAISVMPGDQTQLAMLGAPAYAATTGQVTQQQYAQQQQLMQAAQYNQALAQQQVMSQAMAQAHAQQQQLRQQQYVQQAQAQRYRQMGSGSVTDFSGVMGMTHPPQGPGT